jgi:hypothetical protein
MVKWSVVRWCLAAGTLALIVACGALLPAQGRNVSDVHGAIVEVNRQNEWYGIVPDDDREIRYAPDRLPDEFKKDRVRVMFSGRIGTVDPNVRTWGIPLTLTSIRLEPTP